MPQPAADSSQRPREDRGLEQILGNVLLAGVITAGVVVLAGGILYLGRHGAAPRTDLHKFHSEPSELRSIPGIFKSVQAGQSRGIIQLGLLLLIATPVLRVALSAIAFANQRDYVYILITLFVLSMLFYSLFGHGS